MAKTGRGYEEWLESLLGDAGEEPEQQPDPEKVGPTPSSQTESEAVQTGAKTEEAEGSAGHRLVKRLLTRDVVLSVIFLVIGVLVALAVDLFILGPASEEAAREREQRLLLNDLITLHQNDLVTLIEECEARVRGRFLESAVLAINWASVNRNIEGHEAEAAEFLRLNDLILRTECLKDGAERLDPWCSSEVPTIVDCPTSTTMHQGDEQSLEHLEPDAEVPTTTITQSSTTAVVTVAASSVASSSSSPIGSPPTTVSSETLSLCTKSASENPSLPIGLLPGGLGFGNYASLPAAASYGIGGLIWDDGCGSNLAVSQRSYEFEDAQLQTTEPITTQPTTTSDPASAESATSERIPTSIVSSSVNSIQPDNEPTPTTTIARQSTTSTATIADCVAGLITQGMPPASAAFYCGGPSPTTANSFDDLDDWCDFFLCYDD